ncbi:MAG: competence/damage-inducible protein A [Flavobacteriaceae bacterium]|nr:competence/damage-inducible protein A [Flavobacteriaceae bacterium]
MKAELLTIGDEILIGQIVNTNAVFLSKALNKIGIEIIQITSISDQKEHIIRALDASKKRANIVIITGGLGPTKDDVTKHTLCEYFKDTLVLNKKILDHIEDIFSKYITTPINDQNRQQALLPSKAKIFKNLHGTASGMWFEEKKRVFISLPGVPFEMKSLMEYEVIPALQAHFERPFIIHKTALTYGLGESAIAQRIMQWENQLPKKIKFAYLPNLGRVRLRLSGKGKDEKYLKNQIDTAFDSLIPQIKDIFIGFEGETSLEEQIQNAFIEKKLTLAIAESCTGGEIAARLTKIPGASAYFKGSIITYQTETKLDLLAIPQELIQEHSVVSKEIVQAMASEAREKFNSNIAIATTGNAGPSKGDSSAEVGTVWIAIATAKEVFSEKFLFGKHRERVVQKAVNKALELVFKQLK